MSVSRLLNGLNQLYNRLLYDRLHERNCRSKVTELRLRLRQTQDIIKQFKKNQEALYYSKEMFQEINNKKLRALLHHAKSKSPWYKKTLAKINIEDFTRERLSELPTINKTILMENWDAFVTNPKLSLKLVAFENGERIKTKCFSTS